MEAGTIMLSMMFTDRKLKYFQCPEVDIAPKFTFIYAYNTL